MWSGLLFSFTGSFMQNAAILWHVSLLAPEDQKGLALGGVGLVRFVPIAVFSMITGGLGCLIATGWIAAATPAAPLSRDAGRDEEGVGRRHRAERRH